MKQLGAVIAFGVVGIGLASGCLAAQQATATIKGTRPDSKISGTATVTPVSGGVKVSIRVTNVSAGPHGIHIHEKGDCGDTAKAAGGHFNPQSVKHGFLPKDGPTGAHAGDMGNINVGPDGAGGLDLMLPGLTVDGVVGHAIILHEKVDDFSQPTGNAGSRIGCGVITAPKT